MFSGKSDKSEGKNIHEINMTPLIDVSLVLVVMLLLATPLAFESSITIRKSEASAKTAEKREKIDRVELRIVSDSSVRINRTLVERDELAATLRPLLEQSKDRQVVISCDDSISHGVFVNVLDQAKLCGAKDIAVTGR